MPGLVRLPLGYAQANDATLSSHEETHLAGLGVGGRYACWPWPVARWPCCARACRTAACHPPGREVFAAIARAVLDGLLPADAAARGAAIEAHLGRLDDTIAGLPPALQARDRRTG